MSEEMSLAVAGVSGRMGQMLVQTIAGMPQTKLTAATERPGHDWVGQDLGVMMGGQPNGVIVTDDAGAACAFLPVPGNL